MGVDIANTIRKWRKKLNMSVNDAVEALKKYGFNISIKTLYNWENGTRMPDADVFLALCDIYKIIDINAEIETKKSPTEEFGEGDIKKQRLLHNYDRLNQTGKTKLVDYSDDLTDNSKYTNSLGNDIAADAVNVIESVEKVFSAKHTTKQR